MNVVGFRRYAIELVNFLEVEIYGEIGGYEKTQINELNTADLNNGKTEKKVDTTLAKKIIIINEKSPLEGLKRISGTFEFWVLYGDHKDDPKKINILSENCLADYPEDFKDSIYFKNSISCQISFPL